MESTSLRGEQEPKMWQEQHVAANIQAAIHKQTELSSLPLKTLIVLCGPAGSGKSTFAHTFVAQHQGQGCAFTSIVSSDHCRAMICDDETNQQVSRDAFELFYSIIEKRLLQGRLTIADSTALQASTRQSLMQIARFYHYQTALCVFNMSLQTCLARDQQQTRGRVVGEHVISHHWQSLQQALREIPHEGWDQIHILDERHDKVDMEMIL